MTHFCNPGNGKFSKRMKILPNLFTNGCRSIFAVIIYSISAQTINIHFWQKLGKEQESENEK
jgi:hypothetical protein